MPTEEAAETQLKRQCGPQWKVRQSLFIEEKKKENVEREGLPW